MRVWATPLALAIISAVGLSAALMADGLGDVVSWLALGAPLVMIVRCLARA